MSVIRFWAAHRAELLTLLQQHVLLVFISTLVSVAIGIPAGVAAARRPRLGRAILAVASVAQTIPSLALLGFLLPLPLVGGVGPRTALVALVIYALLPIVRTTVTGIRNVDPAVIEAGIAMGMTPRQLLWLVQFPLAMPSIIAGVRVATVIGVGTTTIAAAIGAGGLGEYIFRGLSMVDTTTILAGAIPAAALALSADGLLALLERRISRGRTTPARAARAAAVATGLVVVFGLAIHLSAGTRAAVVVGSKNFTEQVILGELLAQAIEDEGGVRVVRKLNLGGTFICDRGLRTGELDAYVEYTGTAVSAVFHQDVPRDSRQAFERARDLYARRGLTALDPLGFNNTFAVLVRSADARAMGLRTIEDLRSVTSTWRPGFGYEFLQRQDGYPGLVRAYGLNFAMRPRAMELSLIYPALAEGRVDVIAGDATSALIDALALTQLQDNRHYFPPYDAIPVVRTATLLRYPAIGRALARLAGRISNGDMRAMNAAVDLQHHAVQQVAREFLAKIPRASD
jgi:osmoprotectant transport system substrate-binding protein/osmoprotectant transport system permease protein